MDRASQLVSVSSEEILDAVEMIRSWSSGRLTDDLKRANENTGLLLKAALAGCFKAPNIPDDENDAIRDADEYVQSLMDRDMED